MSTSTLNRLPYPKSEVVGFADCGSRGIFNLTCGPRGLVGEPDHLFHNNGDGTFTDVSERPAWPTRATTMA